MALGSKREQILITGRKLFYEQGIGATSMEQIAEAVPVSKMTIYKYFHSKTGLLEEIVNRLLASVGNRFDELCEQSDNPLDALIGLAKYSAYEEISDIFIKDLIAGYPELIAKMTEFQKAYALPKFEALIFKGQQMGIFRKELSPHLVVMYVLSMKEFFTKNKMFGFDIHVIGEQMIQLFCYGLVSRDYRAAEGKSDAGAVQE